MVLAILLFRVIYSWSKFGVSGKIHCRALCTDIYGVSSRTDPPLKEQLPAVGSRVILAEYLPCLFISNTNSNLSGMSIYLQNKSANLSLHRIAAPCAAPSQLFFRLLKNLAILIFTVNNNLQYFAF